MMEYFGSWTRRRHRRIRPGRCTTNEVGCICRRRSGTDSAGKCLDCNYIRPIHQGSHRSRRTAKMNECS